MTEFCHWCEPFFSLILEGALRGLTSGQIELKCKAAYESGKVVPPFWKDKPQLPNASQVGYILRRYYNIRLVRRKTETVPIPPIVGAPK